MCFTEGSLITLGIAAIIIIAAVMIAQVVLSNFPGLFSGPFATIIKIVVIALAAIAALYFIADLVSCFRLR